MNTFQSEMKVPIRPAPPPPVSQKFPAKSVSSWDSIASQGNWNKSAVPVQKKKPPPRPPPPKFPNKKSVPSRPSQLIAGLFQRKNNGNVKLSECQISRPTLEASAIDNKGSNGLLLIDFNSPPSSPTFTTRSSSDALSVNSFGSDGVTQGSGSSGNASNVESGFEDDFDLFSANGSKKNDLCQPRDPWSPPPKITESKSQVNDKSWVAFPPCNSTKNVPINKGAMPTIIRSKPEVHKTQMKVNNCDTKSNVNKLADALQSAHICSPKTELSSSIFEEEGDDDDGWSSESPPMPTCPPPPPPVMFGDIVDNFDNQAKLEEQRPNGIALYDYVGEQVGDLSFRKDDIINLVRRIDENWFVGEKDGCEGSVPANFISIRVPPREEGDIFVTALYSFQAETWDDLTFEEGSVIKVTHKIDRDWLYGEFNGKSGQFPANFVDHVPEGLPVRKN